MTVRGRQISESLRPISSILIVPGQPYIHKETLTQKAKIIIRDNSKIWGDVGGSKGKGKCGNYTLKINFLKCCLKSQYCSIHGSCSSWEYWCLFSCEACLSLYALWKLARWNDNSCIWIDLFMPCDPRVCHFNIRMVPYTNIWKIRKWQWPVMFLILWISWPPGCIFHA